MHDIKMKLLGIKRKTWGLLSLPVLFLLTVVILSNNLKPTGNGSSEKAHLVASRRHVGPSLKARASKLLNTNGPLDKEYNIEKLLMLGQVETDEDIKTRDKGDQDHAFNEYISSKLSLNRAIPDVRHKLAFTCVESGSVRHQLCHKKVYRPDLPKASVIICFYNEAWSTLLRTVHSVINRTPPHLLYEIVLVDDASDMAHLQNKLAEYMWMIHPNITLVRTASRQGLIRARMYGARVATGEILVFLDSHCKVNIHWLEPLLDHIADNQRGVAIPIIDIINPFNLKAAIDGQMIMKILVFLDSHCEVNIHWLEPLLDHIADNQRGVAIPIIDIINPSNFEYKGASLVKGGFTWGMFFRWDQLPPDYFKDEKSKTDAIETPTMAGGLFAMRRKYFYDMGQYDKELDTWGGENLEMSFRIWLCGGRMDIIPCSRVGHIFRPRRPYGSPNGPDSTLRNSVRVARVWLDDYIKHFFAVQPVAAAMEYGNITDRLALKKKLNCKPFSWYLKYIYSDQNIPGEKEQQQVFHKKTQSNYIQKGTIKQKETGLCLQAEGKGVPVRHSKVVLAKCSENMKDSYQVWKETDSNELVLFKNLCLHVDDHQDKQVVVKLDKCHGAKGTQQWIWTIKNFVYQLYNPTSGKCLVPRTIDATTYLSLQICASADHYSVFKMMPYR